PDPEHRRPGDERQEQDQVRRQEQVRRCPAVATHQLPYFFRLASRILSARAACSPSALAGSDLSSTASLIASSSSWIASPIPGTGGGKCRESTCCASADCSGSALNSADSRNCRRAGTWPPLAQSIECWLT